MSKQPSYQDWIKIARQEAGNWIHSFDKDDMEGYILLFLVKLEDKGVSPTTMGAARFLAKRAAFNYIRNLYGRDGQRKNVVNTFALHNGGSQQTDFVEGDRSDWSGNSDRNETQDPTCTGSQFEDRSVADLDFRRLVHDLDVIDVLMLEMLIEGHTISSLAETWGIPLATMYKRVNTLRDQLVEMGYFPDNDASKGSNDD